jgi:hypothetical protein
MNNENINQNPPDDLPQPKIFASPNVLVAYAICWTVTIVTMLTSITMVFTVSDYTKEKMIEHVALCVVAFVLMHIPLAMYSRYHFHTPPFIQIAMAFLIFAHFVLGEVFRFYDHVFMFDKFLHLTNGLVIAMCGFSIVYGYSKSDDGHIRLSPFFVALFSFCFAVTLLTLWESFEYMVDTLGGFNMQRYKDGLSEVIGEDGVKYMVTNSKQGSGLKDTMNDLMIGMIGAVVVSTVGWMKFKKDPYYTKFLIVRKKPVVTKE